MKRLGKARVLALAAAVLAVVLALPATARAEDHQMTEAWDGTNKTGSITITGLQTGDTITYYKVATIEKHGEDIKTTSYGTINQDVLDDYIARPSEETVSALLAEAQKTPSTSRTLLESDNGAAGPTGCTAGLWIFTFSSGDSSRAYQTMVVPINVSSDGTMWEKDVTTKVKYSTVTVPTLDIELVEDKTSDEGARSGNLITYTATFTVPETYNGGAVDEWHVVLTYGDGMLISDSYPGSSDGDVVDESGNKVGAGQGVYKTHMNKNKAISVDFLKEGGIASISGTYSLTFTVAITDEATIENVRIVGTASPTDDTSDAVLSKTLTHEFYAPEVVKLDAENHALGLSGAAFALYADEACTIPVCDVKGDPVTIASGTNGVGRTEKNVLLKFGQNYYLKETKAPDGYSLNETPVKYYANTDRSCAGGYMSRNFFDTKKTLFSELPATGDAGGAFVVLAGVLLVAGAVVLVRRPR